MRTILTLLLMVLVAGVSAQPDLPRTSVPIPLIHQDEVGNITYTLTIIDPSHYTNRLRPDATDEEIEKAEDQNEMIDPEFYEGYGVLFEADARDDGPICVAKEGANPPVRCLTLGILRELLWEE